jgi:hypothetical protein
MEKNKVTEIVFILDRSGSMSGLEEDTIGGFNGLINKQKNESGEAFVTTVLFDDAYEMIHNRVALKSMEALTDHDYYVRGTTALLDAVGKTILHMKTHLKDPKTKVLFVITTDGMENASCEFSYCKIKEMIERQKEHFAWEFIFLGANIDAVTTAKNLGISEESAATYQADACGTQVNYQAINEAVTCMRHSSKLSSNWKTSIEKDYKSRNNVKNL